MKYLVCEQPGDLRLEEKAFPERSANEALLSIKKIGVCGTDIHAYLGNQAFFSYPRILGHELAAEVVEIDENEQHIKKGDKVVIMPYVSCGKCIACRNGKTNCCTNIAVLGVHTDGGMQEQITVRTDLLIQTNHLSYDQMAIVEPLAIGAHAIRRADIKNGEFIVVVGCGPIGIGIIKLAQIAGAKVIALDTNDARLDYAKNDIGAEYAFNVMNDAAEAIAKVTNGDMATAVFDATGHKGALEKGIDYMAHGGRYVLVGLSKGELTYEHPRIHAKESSILCSRNATLEDFEHVIAVLGQFPTGSFVTHQVSFSETVDQFETLTKPETGVIKALINV